MNSDDAILSDQSEENNEDFLEGLKEMGLLGASGENSLDNSTPKPSKSTPVSTKSTTKKSNVDMSTPKSSKQGNNSKSKSKRRPPSRRPVINIDELLDGIGAIPTMASTPDLNTSQMHQNTPNNTNTNNNSNINNMMSTPNNNQFTNLSNSINSPRNANNNNFNNSYNNNNNFNNNNTTEFSIIQAQTDHMCTYTSRVELNIQSYLTTRFLNLRDDFVLELQRLLIETDIIEIEVNKFLTELKVNLREILSFDTSQNINHSNQILSVLDTICPSFLTVMKAIPSDIVNRERQAEADSAGLAQIAVSTFSPLLKDNFKSLADELSHDITELHELQATIRKNEVKNGRQKKTMNDTLLEYETQKIVQQIESQTINEISSKIAEFRKVLLKDNDDDEDIEFLDVNEFNSMNIERGRENFESPKEKINKKLKKALFKLRKEAENTHLEPSAKIRTFRRKFSDYREEAASMRNMIVHNNQMFAQRSFQALNLMQQQMEQMEQQQLNALSLSQSSSSPYISSTPQQNLIDSSFSSPSPSPMMNSPRGSQSQGVGMGMLTPEKMPRVSFPGMGEDFGNGFQERNFELIDNVRSRLKQIQDQHDADLQNVSSFLQSLKKAEKQRMRSEIVND